MRVDREEGSSPDEVEALTATMPLALAVTPPKSESYRWIAPPAFMLLVIADQLEEHVQGGRDAPLFAGQGVVG